MGCEWRGAAKLTRPRWNVFVKGNCIFPFRNPTYYKSNSTLQSQGYIDSTGNLVAKYDAATVYLGTPWRMPTCAEIDALINN